MQCFVAAHQHQHGDRGVYRVALANPDTDRVLSDREWRLIAEKFVARFGADKGMWEATRHDRHHVHLTISKDRFDGTRMSTSHDYRRVAAICRDLEREHGLTNAAARVGRGTGRVRADAEAAARGKPQPDRDWLRVTISRVLRDGGGLEELRASGVAVRLNEASTGRVSGISYARDSRADRDREADDLLAELIWFKGSKLGKAFGWNQVGEQLRGPAAAPISRSVPEAAEHEQAPEPLMLERSIDLPSSTLQQRRARALKDALDRAAERARTQELHRRQDRGRGR
ncbi:relaxase/mobilization nuclease domain-containing protein (plasmid) [Mycobacterium sp. C3-094]